MVSCISFGKGRAPAAHNKHGVYHKPHRKAIGPVGPTQTGEHGTGDDITSRKPEDDNRWLRSIVTNPLNHAYRRNDARIPIMAEEAITGEILIKQIGTREWPRGPIDLLGYMF